MYMLYNIIKFDHDLSSQIRYRNNPYPNRQKKLFQPSHKRTDYGKFTNPVLRLQHTFNQHMHGSSILNLTKDRFKKALKSKLQFLWKSEIIIIIVQLYIIINIWEKKEWIDEVQNQNVQTCLSHKYKAIKKTS